MPLTLLWLPLWPGFVFAFATALPFLPLSELQTQYYDFTFIYFYTESLSSLCHATLSFFTFTQVQFRRRNNGNENEIRNQIISLRLKLRIGFHSFLPFNLEKYPFHFHVYFPHFYYFIIHFNLTFEYYIKAYRLILLNFFCSRSTSNVTVPWFLTRGSHSRAPRMRIPAPRS